MGAKICCQYSSNEIRKAKNKHLNIVVQNLNCEFNANFLILGGFNHLILYLQNIGVIQIIIWWLIFEKKLNKGGKFEFTSILLNTMYCICWLCFTVLHKCGHTKIARRKKWRRKKRWGRLLWGVTGYTLDFLKWQFQHLTQWLSRQYGGNPNSNYFQQNNC